MAEIPTHLKGMLYWTNTITDSYPKVLNRIVYEESTKTLKYWNGTNWVEAVEVPDVLYSNSEAMPQKVGGWEAGSTFENMTQEQMWTGLLYPTLNPSLTTPSSTFSATQSGLKEIGQVLSITFTANFNRGSINPAYGTSGYRSGLPNAYNYTGTGLTTKSSTALSDSNTVESYTVTEGAQTWTSTVSYDAGEQPLNNKGENYQSPLAAGTTASKSVTITGVYPWYATSTSITETTKQALAAMNSAYVQVTMVDETASEKQKAEFPEAWSEIKGISFYNTVSGKWEWLAGSAAGSLDSWTVTQGSKSVQGASVNYNIYTHNGSMIGSRQLRFHTNTNLAQ